MNSLDILLNKAILQSIQDELDGDRLQQMVCRLQEQGIEISEIFNKLDQIKPLFGFEEDLKKIEDEILRDFLAVEDDSSETWLVIMNKVLSESILKTFVDEDKKLILDFTTTRSETIPRILAWCKMPNTSGYRKMKQLIDDGFVVSTAMEEILEGKRVPLYKSIIQKLQININKNDISAKILVPKEMLDSSQIVKALINVNQGKRIIAN